MRGPANEPAITNRSTVRFPTAERAISVDPAGAPASQGLDRLLSSPAKEHWRDFSTASSWLQYGVAFLVFVITWVIGLVLRHWIGYQAIGLVFLLAVVLLALKVSRGPICFGTALMATGWSYCFAPPIYSLHIADPYDRLMMAMYFIIAFTVNQLTERLRAERQAEHQREQRATALYLLTHELADAPDMSMLLNKVTHQVGTVFDAQVSVLLPKGGKLAPSAADTWRQNKQEQALSAWVFEHDQPAGRGSEVEPEAEGLHLPLSASNTPAGVIALRFNSDKALTQHQRNLLDNFAWQIALVLDCQRLRDAQVNTKLLAESERLGRTLLNSVSHELRTPLAAITTASQSLSHSKPLTDLQSDLALEIESASARLNRLVQSLLNAVRLQSGQVRPQLDWCDMADLVRVTVRNLRGALGTHPLKTHLSPGLPLAKADFVLLEQALANLLINAVTHTAPGTPIEITTRQEAGSIVLEVLDRGPGLPPEHLERAFELFHRLPNAKPGGVGLGLAIVKGFIEAQGGRVTALNRPGGGAVFALQLPAAETPQLPEENL